MKAWQIVLSTALLLSLFSFGNATILSVALDGSQPYTVIQEAINTSAHGDTVLVYPGRYYENIRFFGKNISLASLELTTGNLDYSIAQSLMDQVVKRLSLLMTMNLMLQFVVLQLQMETAVMCLNMTLRSGVVS